MAANVLYKCRRCGVEYAWGSVPDGGRFMLFAVHGVPMPESWGAANRPGPLDAHSCEDRGRGVADLVGVAPPG